VPQYAQGHASTAGPDPSNSTLKSYLAIEKREGLKTIGKRILQGAHIGELSVQWQKTFHEDDHAKPADGGRTLAISAFSLSALPNAAARKQLVREMWDSGAETIVRTQFLNCITLSNLQVGID
jgi:hypothetical protein